MKITRDEFLRLQETWYEKLEESGFKDIEKLHRGELILIENSTRVYRNCADLFEIEMREEYFRQIAHAVHDEETCFRNETDRYILTRRAEGAHIKEIESELKTNPGRGRKRWAIRGIIQRYEAAWGLRAKK